MKIEIQFWGHLRAAMEMPCIELELPAEATVGDLATALRAAQSAESAPLLDEQGLPGPGILVVLNDRALPPGALAAAKLRDGDRIVLLPPIAGG